MSDAQEGKKGTCSSPAISALNSLSSGPFGRIQGVRRGSKRCCFQSAHGQTAGGLVQEYWQGSHTSELLGQS